MNHKLKKFVLLLGDIIVLYGSLYLTLLVRYGEQPSSATWQSHIGPFTLIFAAWLLVFYITGLYNLHLAVNNGIFFRLAVRSVLIAGLLSAVFFYLNPNINIAPKTNLAIFVAVVGVLFALWRRLYNWSLSSYLPKERILVVGYNGQVRGLIHALEKNPHLGYRIASIITADAVPESAGNIAVTPDVKNLKAVITEKGISTIVLASDPHDSPELRAALISCLPLKVDIINLSAFYETVTGRVTIEDIGEMWFLENLSRGKRAGFDAAKRAYDFVFALLLLVFSLPLWPLIMAAIKLESPGPAFFLNPRLGKDNRVFNLVKFRTMREEGNDRTLTRPDDPRITAFGSFLRKTRMDELPQVLNILRGEMSFVGPRPERPELARELEKTIPFYGERMLVKPGLTGSDQISGEYHSPTREDTIKKLQYDFFYIKNRSIYLDLSIILKTIATVFSRGGL